MVDLPCSINKMQTLIAEVAQRRMKVSCSSGFQDCSTHNHLWKNKLARMTWSQANKEQKQKIMAHHTKLAMFTLLSPTQDCVFYDVSQTCYFTVNECIYLFLHMHNLSVMRKVVSGSSNAFNVTFTAANSKTLSCDKCQNPEHKKPERLKQIFTKEGTLFKTSCRILF